VILKVDNYSVSYDGDDSQESTWRFDKPSRNGDHPTMKPIRLVARAIVNSSAPADIVLDGFLGSGSTLIASDQTGRVCYGTELDPRYCDVIVKRWENMTGKKAILEERVA
jgi:DNA modification methylase